MIQLEAGNTNLVKHTLLTQDIKTYVNDSPTATTNENTLFTILFYSLVHMLKHDA